MRTIAIFKTGILPATQTFVAAQAGALQAFRPQYVGLERVANGRPVHHSIVLMKKRSLKARLDKAFYKITGVGPSFHREIAASNPALLHAHFIMDGIHALPIADRLRIPLVVTLHAHLPTSFGKVLPKASLDNILYTTRLQALWNRANVFICVSDFIRKRAVQLGYPASKLQVHYVGVDRILFRRSDRPRDSKLVVFVGRLIERKGVRYLIEAMVEVKKHVPDARLLIIGAGPERESLEHLSKNLGVNAEFTGELYCAEIREWLSRARIFAAPSITAPDGDAEALGMVFAEAQATGLPVVSCYHGGVPEVVRDGETGLLAPERDTKTLASHILRFLTDDAFWQACSNRATSWIEERFDLMRQTEELEQIYSSLLQ